MTLLTKHDSVSTTNGVVKYKDSDLGGDLPFKAEATVSSGYTDVTNLANWDIFWFGTNLDYKDYRNTLIQDYETSWGTLTDDEKKVLIRNYIYPSETPVAELDALYSKADRDKFRTECIEALKTCGCFIVLSSDDPDVYLNITCTSAEVLDPKTITTDTVI